MELTEIFAALKDSGVKPDDFAKALHEHLPDHYTHLFNAGHSKARGEYSDKLKGKDSEIEGLKSALSEKEGTIKDLSAKSPDLAEIEEKYKASQDKLAKALEDAEAARAEEVNGLKSKIRDGAIDRFRSNMVAEMVKRGVDPDYADFKSRDAALLARIEYDEEHGVTGAKQADGVTAIPNPSSRPLHELLAREMMDSVPGKFIDDRRAQGANLGNGASDHRTFTRDQIKNLSDADFEQNLESLVKAQNEGRIE